MFQHQGIWLPDGEKHFPEWMTRNGERVDGLGTYQIKKLREAMKWPSAWRRAVDVGAHVGLWSMQLSKQFGRIEAFEPVPQFRDCWERNMATQMELNRKAEHYCSLALHHCALGADEKGVFMNVDPADTGGTHIERFHRDDIQPKDLAQQRRLDDFGFTDVDFIKIDCEGYELEVLRGAEQTLAACRPAVIVEQKQHKLGPNFGIKGVPAVDFLREHGMVLRKEMGGDFILSF